MPLTRLEYRPNKGLEELALQLAEKLPVIIAPALNIGGRENLEGRVRPEDITVHVRAGGEHDVNARDLEIRIWAHDFPERLANLEERKDAIRDEVRWFVGGHFTSSGEKIRGCVSIQLQPTAYGQF